MRRRSRGGKDRRVQGGIQLDGKLEDGRPLLPLTQPPCYHHLIPFQLLTRLNADEVAQDGHEPRVGSRDEGHQLVLQRAHVKVEDAIDAAGAGADKLFQPGLDGLLVQSGVCGKVGRGRGGK